MDSQIINLKRRVAAYKEILQNTETYRQVWKDELKAAIIQQLEDLVAAIGLDANVTDKGEMENLEAIVLSLGDVKSGMYKQVSEDVKRHLIKHNGSLVYQQLFNGKVIVLINYPFIENYGQPRPPKTVAIYRPEELRAPFYIRHLEEFITEISNWEDFDDDEPNKRIGFQINFGDQIEEPQS